MTYPIECNPCFGTGRVHSPYSSEPFQTCPSCEGKGKHRPLVRSATLVDAERYRAIRDKGIAFSAWNDLDGVHWVVNGRVGMNLDVLVDEELLKDKPSAAQSSPSQEKT